MIRIGLDAQEKQAEIDQYLPKHDINKIFAFYPDQFPLTINAGVEVEHIRYADIIEYKFFYSIMSA